MSDINNRIKLGVIADDFTGASDAASFLVKAGQRVVMLADIHSELKEECDVLVVALKIRSVSPNQAIAEVKETLDYFKKSSVEKVYYKYCSTFDSTPRGNIGVVLDYLMDYFDTRYTILCPSLPVNGRTVKDGVLYVDSVPLAKTSMKNHPLNPMWDSYIPALMKNQSQHHCYVVEIDEMIKVIESIKDDKFYLVPDYQNDEDGKMIAKVVHDFPLLSGGSGLLEHLELGQSLVNTEEYIINKNSEKAIILCGSCSKMTGRQIEDYIQKGNPYFELESKAVLQGRINASIVFQQVLKNLPQTTIVFSDGINKDMAVISKNEEFEKLSVLIEKIIADLSEMADKNKFDRIVIAGGETSGAVTKRLDYNAYAIGKVIAPGVPILIPLINKDLCLVLKSGNFGDVQFFTKAIK